MASDLRRTSPKPSERHAESGWSALSNAGLDNDWHERITLAKRAREFGRKARKGKPIVFQMTRSTPRYERRK